MFHREGATETYCFKYSYSYIDKERNWRLEETRVCSSPREFISRQKGLPYASLLCANNWSYTTTKTFVSNQRTLMSSFLPGNRVETALMCLSILCSHVGHQSTQFTQFLHLSVNLRPHQVEGVKFLYECVMGFRGVSIVRRVCV